MEHPITERRPRHRPAAVVLVAAVALMCAACFHSSAGERTQAIERLRLIDGMLNDLDRAYAAGKIDEAHDLAEKIYVYFNDTIAERVLNRTDRALKGQTEDVLEDELRAKVKAKAPKPEVAALVKRAHQLVARSIQEIGR